MNSPRLSGEFSAIDRFTGHFSSAGRGLSLGPGDDAALLLPRKGLALVATVDAIREGLHFTRRFRPEEIGHKALAVNLSDLAAMGATPRWFLAALELPERFRRAGLDGLARGMAALARAEGCVLAGGNVIGGERLAITITALGEVPEKLALRRDGLRPGDAIGVTGTLGAAALGLRLLKAGRRVGAASQLRPQARVSSGRAALGLARAAIDVSDGLAQDLAHLAARSGCGAELWADTIPMSPAVASQPDALELCLSGGEDYELVFGLPPDRVHRLRARLARLGVLLTIIGRATRRRGLRVGPRKGGLALDLERPGFTHF